MVRLLGQGTTRTLFRQNLTYKVLALLLLYNVHVCYGGYEQSVGRGRSEQNATKFNLM